MWLGSRITDAHGMAAFDFATVADCSQLVNGPTHRAGGVSDLVLTNVPDLCDVHVHGNVGSFYHASLGVALNLSPTIAGFDVARAGFDVIVFLVLSLSLAISSSLIPLSLPLLSHYFKDLTQDNKRREKNHRLLSIFFYFNFPFHFSRLKSF